jgi:2-dehydro-3-deoxyphosphooctonate aldolase (KDO 8-P synthase)
VSVLKVREIVIGNIKVGGENPLFLVAGPCVIESQDMTLEVAETLKLLSERLKIPFVFKSSYDKANRSSVDSYRGPGLKAGLRILAEVKERLSVPVLSDVHAAEEVSAAAEVLDVLQIPAFLSRQTDLIQAAARTGKALNLKKGQFLAPWDMKNAVRKAEAVGSKRILLTERGTSFGYNNLVSDFRSIPIMRRLGYPVVYDATHSVQIPGGLGTHSGGERALVPFLARAAVACGVDGVFLEVHPNPDEALCDGPNMMALDAVEDLLRQLLKIRESLNLP